MKEKEFAINVAVEREDGAPISEKEADELTDKFIEFIEANGYVCGGAIGLE